jgi:hypothetical protein
MTNEDFVTFRDQFNKECEDTLLKKGEAYTQNSADRHKNFKANAERWGLSPIQVWAIYFGKHLDSITHFVKNGKEGPEGVRGNFMDLRNYVDLGLSLIEEEKKEEVPF